MNTTGLHCVSLLKKKNMFFSIDIYKFIKHKYEKSSIYTWPYTVLNRKFSDLFRESIKGHFLRIKPCKNVNHLANDSLI